MTEASPSLRFSRDRRGYEHFYLVEAATSRRSAARARVLYWFRTPPGVKVGRAPFDDEMKRAIEEGNPGVCFDWKRILATPIPPPAPDVERWRLRRDAAPAGRAARKGEAAVAAAAEGGEPDLQERQGPAGALPASGERLVRSGDQAGGNSIPVSPAATSSGGVSEPRSQRRRRRRGGRGRRSGGSLAGESAPAPSGDVALSGDAGRPQHLDEPQWK